jgi:hypothetical protein
VISILIIDSIIYASNLYAPPNSNGRAGAGGLNFRLQLLRNFVNREF